MMRRKPRSSLMSLIPRRHGANRPPQQPVWVHCLVLPHRRTVPYLKFAQLSSSCSPPHERQNRLRSFSKLACQDFFKKFPNRLFYYSLDTFSPWSGGVYPLPFFELLVAVTSWNKKDLDPSGSCG